MYHLKLWKLLDQSVRGSTFKRRYFTNQNLQGVFVVFMNYCGSESEVLDLKEKYARLAKKKFG